MSSHHSDVAVLPRDAARTAILGSSAGTQKQALQKYKKYLETLEQEKIPSFALEDVEAVIVLDQYRSKVVPHMKNGDLVVPKVIVSDGRKSLELRTDMRLSKADPSGIRIRDPEAGIFVTGSIDGKDVGKSIPMECRFEPFSYAVPYAPEVTATVWISPVAYLNANRDTLEKAGFHVNRAKENYFREFSKCGASVKYCNFPKEDVEKYVFSQKKDSSRGKMWEDDVLER